MQTSASLFSKARVYEIARLVEVKRENSGRVYAIARLVEVKREHSGRELASAAADMRRLFVFAGELSSSLCRLLVTNEAVWRNTVPKTAEDRRGGTV